QVGARGDVVADGALGVERVAPQDRVADEAVGVRRVQQRLELGARAGRVEAAPDDRVEARVPVPLPRVAARRGHRERVVAGAVVALAPVALQQRPRGGADVEAHRFVVPAGFLYGLIVRLAVNVVTPIRIVALALTPLVRAAPLRSA